MPESSENAVPIQVQHAIAHARQVDCPDCGAVAGEPCALPDGRTHLSRGQLRRWLAAEVESLAELLKENEEDRVSV